MSADKGYGADWLRADLRKNDITPIIPGKRGRKRKIRHDKRRYRERWRIEATFNHPRTSAASPPVATNSPATTSQQSL